MKGSTGFTMSSAGAKPSINEYSCKQSFHDSHVISEFLEEVNDFCVVMYINDINVTKNNNGS